VYFWLRPGRGQVVVKRYNIKAWALADRFWRPSRAWHFPGWPASVCQFWQYSYLRSAMVESVSARCGRVPADLL